MLEMTPINDMDNVDVDFGECTEYSVIEDTDFEETIFFDEELYQIISEYRYQSGCDPYVY